MGNAGDRSTPSGPPAGPSGPPRTAPGPGGLRSWLPVLLSIGAVVVVLIVTLVVLGDDGSDSVRTAQPLVTTQPATSTPPTTVPDNSAVPSTPTPETAAPEAEAPAPTSTTAVPTPTGPTPPPATTAPPPTVNRALEFVDVAYNVDALPAGVVGHGGGALTGDLLYWIAHTEDAQGEMLWLETPLVETAEGVTDWLVLDAVRLPAPGLLTGDVAGLWGVPCWVDGELDEEVVAVFEWSLNDPLVDPLVVWRASRQTLRFEPITGVVECMNEGAGV